MIRFSIVGCGHIAHKHAVAIQNASGANLAAICDTNRIAAEAFAAKYNAQAYLDYETMLIEADVDVVCICTPSGLHGSLAVAAARAGKHLVIEKPVTLTLEEADLIVNACRAAGVYATVVHPNRFRPALLELKHALDQGYFGKVSHVNATIRWNRDQAYYDQASWRGTKTMDGGVLMNQAIHSLDILLWLMGPVRSVQALSATRLRNIETEDVAVAMIEFESGVLGVVEAAATIYKANLEESISLFGETGSAIVSGKTANWIKHWSFEQVSEEDGKLLMEQIAGDPYGVPGHQRIIEDMVLAIREGREPVISLQDGINALKLVLDIYKAANAKDMAVHAYE